MLKGKSNMGSIDNLYKSMVGLDDNKYLKSSDLKDKLLKYGIAHQFKIQKQILPLEEVPPSNYSCYSEFQTNKQGLLPDKCGYLTDVRAYKAVNVGTREVCAPLSYLEPQSSNGDTNNLQGGKGFLKSPAQFMVTDDLVVTTCSSISAVSFLSRLKVSPSDLEERVLTIGKEEGLSLLKASLISSSTLTNGLGQFLKTIKEEKI